MYKLTVINSQYNTGSDVEIHLFDDIYKLQDYIETQAYNMDDEARELYYYNLDIQEL